MRSIVLAVLLIVCSPALAHMAERPDLNQWFAGLGSKKGLCCSFVDGLKVEDVDWDTQDGHYRVRLGEQWVIVPDTAVVEAPNRFGPAVVWPYKDGAGEFQIRCFLPGAGA